MREGNCFREMRMWGVGKLFGPEPWNATLKLTAPWEWTSMLGLFYSGPKDPDFASLLHYP